MKQLKLLMSMCLVALALLGCSSNSPNEKTDENKTNIVATTTMLGDAIKIIGGDAVDLSVLMGPGIDPHLYKASAGDVSRMQKADLIVYNGLHLEGKLSDLFEAMEKNNKKTYAAASVLSKIDTIESLGFEGSYDPHIWFDVSLWMKVVEGIKNELVELDAENKEIYQSNASAYLEELERLDIYVKNRANEVTKEKRVLITAHDAFSYFGRAYGFEVKGLQGLSTATEAGTSDVRELATFIAEKKIPAIFIESSVPTRNMEALKNAVESRNFTVNIGGELFSDSLGDPDTKEGSYIGTVEHNINTIVDALK